MGHTNGRTVKKLEHKRNAEMGRQLRKMASGTQRWKMKEQDYRDGP